MVLARIAADGVGRAGACGVSGKAKGTRSHGLAALVVGEVEAGVARGAMVVLGPTGLHGDGAVAAGASPGSADAILLRGGCRRLAFSCCTRGPDTLTLAKANRIRKGGAADAIHTTPRCRFGTRRLRIGRVDTLSKWTHGRDAAVLVLLVAVCREGALLTTNVVSGCVEKTTITLHAAGLCDGAVVTAHGGVRGPTTGGVDGHLGAALNAVHTATTIHIVAVGATKACRCRRMGEHDNPQ